MANNDLVKYEEAIRSISNEPDDFVRAFLKFGLTTALTRTGVPAGAVPAAPLDLSYFCELLRSMAHRKSALDALCAGDFKALEFFPGEEEP